MTKSGRSTDPWQILDTRHTRHTRHISHDIDIDIFEAGWYWVDLVSISTCRDMEVRRSSRLSRSRHVQQGVQRVDIRSRDSRHSRPASRASRAEELTGADWSWLGLITSDFFWVFEYFECILRYDALDGWLIWLLMYQLLLMYVAQYMAPCTCEKLKVPHIVNCCPCLGSDWKSRYFWGHPVHVNCQV